MVGTSKMNFAFLRFCVCGSPQFLDPLLWVSDLAVSIKQISSSFYLDFSREGKWRYGDGEGENEYLDLYTHIREYIREYIREHIREH